MDLINRQELIAVLGDEPEVWCDENDYQLGLNNQWHYDVNLLKAMPAIDAVEVVRCKDCKHLLVMIEETGYGRCKLDGRLFPGFGRYDTRTWFCADGERSEDAEDQ